MSVYKYANSAQTTLNNGGTLGSGDPTVTVTDGSVFPATGIFVVKIGTELATIASRSSNVLTFAARGVEGTSAASHADGSTITGVLSAGALLGLSSEIVQSDTVANIPAAAQNGNLFLPSDGVGIYRDTGSAQELWAPSFKVTQPISGDFSWINQGGASIDLTRGGVYLSSPGSLDQVRMRVKAAPTPPYKIEGAFIPTVTPISFPAVGLCWYDGTKVVTQGFAQNNGSYLAQWTSKWNSVSSFNGTYAMAIENLNSFRQGPLMWFRMIDDNTNRITQISNDGHHWLTTFSVGRTDFLTPTHVGFFVYDNNVAYEAGIWLLHWKETA